VFVFVAAWRGAPSHDVNHRPLALALRLSYAYDKAGSAMLATSSTTAVAFLGSTVSTIAPIAQFGFFMGLLVTP
jgi:hypothetical protein